jgi:trehalose 6-phosphate synthase
MRLSVRLSVSLVLGVALVSMAFALYQTQSERHGLKRELERHAVDLAMGMERSAAPLVANRSTASCSGWSTASRVTSTWRALQSTTGESSASDNLQAGRARRADPRLGRAIDRDQLRAAASSSARVRIRCTSSRCRFAAIAEWLARSPSFHETSYIETRSAAMWQRGLATVVVQTVLIVAVTLLMLRWGLGRPVERLALWLRDLRTGSATGSPELPEEDVFKP